MNKKLKLFGWLKLIELSITSMQMMKKLRLYATGYNMIMVEG